MQSHATLLLSFWFVCFSFCSDMLIIFCMNFGLNMCANFSCRYLWPPTSGYIFLTNTSSSSSFSPYTNSWSSSRSSTLPSYLHSPSTLPWPSCSTTWLCRPLTDQSKSCTSTISTLYIFVHFIVIQCNFTTILKI